MITLLSNLPDNTVGVAASGRVNATDYETVLIPAIEAALGRPSSNVERPPFGARYVRSGAHAGRPRGVLRDPRKFKLKWAATLKVQS